MHAKGFTLTELIITILVLAVFTTLAVPSMRSFIQNNRASTQANELVTALQLARSEALKRGMPVSVCASTDGLVCGGSWSEGWLVREDENDTLLQSWPALGQASIANDGGLPNAFQYIASGRTSLDATLTFELRLSDCTRESNRDIVLVPTGRVAVRRVACP